MSVVSIGHLNTQLMIFSFDKFQVMVHIRLLDLLALLERRLKDEKHLLKYLQVPAYTFSYKNLKKAIVVNYYRKMLHLRCLTAFCISVWMRKRN